MFLLLQASTVAFDEIASLISNNCRSSALEVCWRDLPTPIHALVVCTAGPPIPARGATRTTASICPTSGQPLVSFLAHPPSCLVNPNQPRQGRATPALLQHALVATTLSTGLAEPQRTLKWRRRTFANVHPRRSLEGSVCLQPFNTWLSHRCSDVGKWQQNPCHAQRLRHAKARARIGPNFCVKRSQSRQALVANHTTQRRGEETTKRTGSSKKTTNK